MMRRSARIAGLIVVGLLSASCEEKNPDAVTQVPEDPGNTLGDLAPLEATASSMLTEQPSPPPQTARFDNARFSTPPPGRTTGAPTVHTVQPRETLYSIAIKYYNDGKQWRRIQQANKARLSDPTQMAIGTKLIIP